MSTHPIGPSGQAPGLLAKPAPRKPPAKRLFSGVAGSPLFKICRLKQPERPTANPTPGIAFLETVLDPQPCASSIERCEHGIYNPHQDGKYCTICNPVRVRAKLDPKHPKHATRIATVAPVVVVQPFETEIRKAMSAARDQFRDQLRQDEFKDLRQIIVAEIFKAMNKYGERINEKLAYRIARNQVNRYLIERRKKGLTMVPTGVTPSVSGFTPAKGEDGEELDYSIQEAEIAQKQAEGQRFVDDLDVLGIPKSPLGNTRDSQADWLELNIDQLRALVKTWHGTKRRIGEILLNSPDTAVREFPGIPKTTAAKVRAVVLTEFKKRVPS